MKNSLAILLLATSIFFTACEVCTECSFEDLNGFETGEFCGTSEEVKNHEEEILQEAENLGVVATCTRL